MQRVLETIDIKLYKAVEGLKEYTGVLKEYDKRQHYK